MRFLRERKEREEFKVCSRINVWIYFSGKGKKS